MRHIRRGRGRSPSQSPIGRGAHLLEVVVTRVVKLGITVAIVGTGGRVIADRPVFVVKLPISRHSDRSAPAQSSSGRAADEHIDNRWNRIPEAEVGDYPNPMLGIIGDRGVTSTRIDSWRVCVDGRTFQE